MKTLQSTISFLTVVFIGISFSATSNAQFEASAKWVPDSANTIVMIRGAKILDSEFAKENKWKRKGVMFNSGLSFGPGKTERILIASQLDFEFMEPVWTVSVFEKKGGTVDIVDVSRRTGGSLDELGGMRAIALPSDAYVIQLDKDTIGSVVPANRQHASRWLRSRKNAGMDLSPYLTQAVKFADQNADIIMAFDFADVVHPKHVHGHLSKVCKPEDMDAVCEAVCSIKGATLGITINDKISGAIKIDFAGDISSISANGKEFLFEILRNNGVMIDDLKTWTYRVSANQLRLDGALSPSALRKIASVIQDPIMDNSDGYASDNVDEKTRSLQYFHDVERISGELRKKKAKAMSTHAAWYSRYARMIDKLPVVGVDPELLDYGQYVANSFRDITGVLRSANFSKISSRSAYSDVGGGGGGGGELGIGLNVGGSYSGGGYSRYGSYGGYGDNGYSVNNDNTRSRQIAGGQERVRGFNSANEIVLQIDTVTAKIRQSMSQKYSTEF